MGRLFDHTPHRRRQASLLRVFLAAVAAVSCGGGSPTSPTPPPPTSAPTLTAIAPVTGSTAGGTEVTLTGTNFFTGATVALGGVTATNVRVLGTTSIVAVTGPHAAGAVDVVVAVGTQSATLPGAFSYTAPPPPTVTAIAPTTGTTAGGTPVTITGTNFAAGATVAIGGVAATSVAVLSATSMTAVTAARTAGTADVVVTQGGQTATLRGAFTYTAPQQNPLPVITSLTVQGTRTNQPPNLADLGEEVVVTATIQDNETPVSQLLIEWAADTGTFTGAGPSVRWRAPASGLTPAVATLTVKVTEVIGALGDWPGAVTQSVSASTTVRVHDSTKEVGDQAVGFLLDFSNSTLSPEYVVRNFWDGCPGKAAELEDVRNNRLNYLITGYKIGTPSAVTVAFGGTCALGEAGDACVTVACEWDDIYKPLNEPGKASGTCYLSHVYRNSKWWLCSSRFQGTSTHPPRGVTFMR